MNELLERLAVHGIEVNIRYEHTMGVVIVTYKKLDHWLRVYAQNFCICIDDLKNCRLSFEAVMEADLRIFLRDFSKATGATDEFIRRMEEHENT